MRVHPAGTVIDTSVTLVPPRIPRYATITSVATVPAGLFAEMVFTAPPAVLMAEARNVAMTALSR